MYTVYQSNKADKIDGVIVDENDKMKFSDVKNFSLLFWLIVLMVISSVTAIWNILMLANDWITERFGIDEIMTGNIISGSYIILIVLVPLVGQLGDTYT